LAHQKVDRPGVECDQERHIGPVVFAIDFPKADNERGIVRNRCASQFLKFREFAQCDAAPRVVRIAGYLVIVTVLVIALERVGAARLFALLVFKNPSGASCPEIRLRAAPSAIGTTAFAAWPAWSSCRVLPAQAEEAQAGPAGAGHGKGDLRPATRGDAVPDKALV
jgi:hypothetical protein